MDKKEIGKRIKKLRIAKDWTQNKLATESGVAASYIPALENGLKCPTIETLDNICFALGISLADFFTEKREETLLDKVSSLTEKQKQLLNDFLNSL